MSIVIKTQNLERTFKTYEKPEGLINSIKGIWNRKHIEKKALASTTIDIEDGKIIGIVGANGAGKTTLLKLLSGLIHPSSGTAQVLGFTPWERKPEYLKQISILLGQKNQLWWDITPADSFDLLARIYDLDRVVVRKRWQDLSDMFRCMEQTKIQLRRLSLGERMKMEVIGSLLHKPKILFLDEPTIGLDLVAQDSIRNFLLKYVKIEKPTILLTSHYMDDIAKLADQLLLMSKGQIVFRGTVNEFSKKTESLQQIVAKLNEPLTQDLNIFGNIIVKGSTSILLKISQTKLPEAIKIICNQASLQDLKIEETDFEDSIRKFLESEHRVL